MRQAQYPFVPPPLSPATTGTGDGGTSGFWHKNNGNVYGHITLNTTTEHLTDGSCFFGTEREKTKALR